MGVVNRLCVPVSELIQFKVIEVIAEVIVQTEVVIEDLRTARTDQLHNHDCRSYDGENE